MLAIALDDEALSKLDDTVEDDSVAEEIDILEVEPEDEDKDCVGTREAESVLAVALDDEAPSKLDDILDEGVLEDDTERPLDRCVVDTVLCSD